MTTRRIGPFDAASFAAGLLTATPLLLVVAFFTATANPSGSIAATLAITGLALGAIAAAVYTVSIITAHDKDTHR